MIVVADAGPLHYLVLIEEADVLEPLYSLDFETAVGRLRETNFYISENVLWIVREQLSKEAGRV
jgi:hypothetical protein